MNILDGKSLKADIAIELKQAIEQNIAAGSVALPKLVILQIGDNPVSNVYIKQKINFANQIGAIAELVKFEEGIETEKVLEKVRILNSEDFVHGIILQLPVPKNIKVEDILNTISSEKDVDGLGSENLTRLLRGDETGIVPATARGILKILDKYNISVEGKKITIVGRSVLVGKSTALLLLQKDATVTICHSKTPNIAEFTKDADIIISAVGKPGIIGDDCVNEKQTIIDVGISKDGEGMIVGDVKLVDKKVSAISPVPGGVGQMTVASLFQNLIETWKRQNK